MRQLYKVGEVVAFTTGKTIREVVGPADVSLDLYEHYQIRTEYSDGTALEMHISPEVGWGGGPDDSPSYPADVSWYALEATDPRS